MRKNVTVAADIHGFTHINSHTFSLHNFIGRAFFNRTVHIAGQKQFMQTMIQTSNKNAQLEAHTVECIMFDGVGVTAEKTATMEPLKEIEQKNSI